MVTLLAAGITGDDLDPHSIRSWAGCHVSNNTGRLGAAAVLSRECPLDCLRQIALDPSSCGDDKPDCAAASGGRSSSVARRPHLDNSTEDHRPPAPPRR